MFKLDKIKNLFRYFFSARNFIKNPLLQQQWLFLIIFLQLFFIILPLDFYTCFTIIGIFISLFIVIHLLYKHKPFKNVYRALTTRLNENPKLIFKLKAIIISLVLFRMAYFEYYKLLCLYIIILFFYFVFAKRNKNGKLTSVEKKIVDFKEVISSDLNIMHNHWVDDLPLWLFWYRINKVFFFSIVIYASIFGIPAFNTVKVLQGEMSLFDTVVSEVILHAGFLCFLNIYCCTYLNIWILKYANPYTQFMYKTGKVFQFCAVATAPAIMVFGLHFTTTNPELEPFNAGIFRDLYQEHTLEYKFKSKCQNAVVFQNLFPGEKMPVDKHGYVNEFELSRRLNNHSSMITTKIWNDATPSWYPKKKITVNLIQPEITKENISGLDLTNEQQESLDNILQKINEIDELRAKYKSDALDIINSGKDDCLDE